MRTILIIVIFIYNSAYSQTNLIFNSSFEDFTPQVGQFNPEYVLLGGTILNSYSENIPCWTTTKPNGTNWKNTYVFVFSPYQPFFQPTLGWSGNEDFWDEYFRFYTPELTFPFDDIFNAPGFNILQPNNSFSATNGNNYISLITTPQQESGANTEIGGGGFTGIAPDVTSQDVEIYSPLLNALEVGKEYQFSIDMAKITGLNSDESSDENTNPKVTIKLKKSGGGVPKTIFNEFITEDNWQTFTETVEVNSDGYDIIWIRVGRKYSKDVGVFIDNVQLYDDCETDLNICENPELFKPLLNINIQEAEFESTVGGAPLTIKTVKVSGLKVATYAKITITDMSGTITYRTIFDGENPPDVIMWDGKNDAGDVMPDVHYKCKVEASNLCYPLQTFIQKFKKESEIQVFDPDIYVNDWGGVTINDLHEAAFVAVSVVFVLTDDEVFYGQVAMPEDSIGWNGSIGNNLFPFVSPLLFVESGYYRVSVAIQSKCGFEVYSEILFINELEIVASYFSGDYNDPLYQWGVVPDKNIPPCGYFINDNPFYRVPKDCCLGDLYLDNEVLWGNLTFNILGNVYISNTVTAVDGSMIVINSGDGVVATIETIISLGSNVIIGGPPVCEPCNCNKSFELNQDSTIIEKIEIDSSTILRPESLKLESVKITPNPATDFVTVLIPESKNYTKYELFNSKGEIIFDGQIISKEFRIDISKITVGEYFIRFTSATERETVRLIVL